MTTITRRWLPLLAALAVFPLLVGATCGSGGDDDGGAADVTNTPPAGGAESPTATVDAASTVAPDREVDVLDSGFTALRGGVQGGFIAHNKSQTEAVEVGFTILDDLGAPISGAHGTVVLMPDETHGIAFAGAYPEEDPVDRIGVQLELPAARWTSVSSTDHLTATITSTETQFVNGTVANPFSVPTGSLWMHVITYNAAGNIIGGSTVGLPSVPASGSSDFRAQVPFVADDYANNARVEAYAEFQNALLPGLAQ